MKLSKRTMYVAEKNEPPEGNAPAVELRLEGRNERPVSYTRHHRSQFPSAVGPMLVCDCQMDAVAMERLARIPIGLSSWRKRKKFGFEEKWRVADTVGNGMYRLNNPGRSKEC